MKDNYHDIIAGVERLKKIKAPKQMIANTKGLVRSLETPRNTHLFRYVYNVRWASYTSVILVLLMGGLTVAASSTTPGDVLYPVKLSVEQFTKPIIKPQKETLEKPKIIDASPTPISLSDMSTPTPAISQVPEEKQPEKKDKTDETTLPTSEKVKGDRITAAPEATPTLTLSAETTPATSPSIEPTARPTPKKEEEATSSSQKKEKDVFIHIPIINKKIKLNK